MGTALDRALWLTLPGASRSVVLGWLVALAATALATPWLLGGLGPAGSVIAIFAVGWAVARRAASPLEPFRRYHLDDLEVTAMGPGGQVRRLAWAAVETITQSRRALRLEGAGATITLPLLPLVARGVWGAVLARVVPALADELWALMDEGEDVRLAPRPEPGGMRLGWWAVAPALLACALGAGATGLLVTGAVLAAERLLAHGWARARCVIVHRGGTLLRNGMRSVLIDWPRAEVERYPDGLRIGLPEGPCGLLGPGLPNYWAAAPVIELRAQLGPTPVANVSFRVRLDEGQLAVVGEVDPSA